MPNEHFELNDVSITTVPLQAICQPGQVDVSHRKVKGRAGVSHNPPLSTAQRPTRLARHCPSFTPSRAWASGKHAIIVLLVCPSGKTSISRGLSHISHSVRRPTTIPLEELFSGGSKSTEHSIDNEGSGRSKPLFDICRRWRFLPRHSAPNSDFCDSGARQQPIQNFGLVCMWVSIRQGQLWNNRGAGMETNNLIELVTVIGLVAKTKLSSKYVTWCVTPCEEMKRLAPLKLIPGRLFFLNDLATLYR